MLEQKHHACFNRSFSNKPPSFFLLENEIFDGRGNSTQTGRSIIITEKLLAAQKALHCYNK